MGQVQIGRDYEVSRDGAIRRGGQVLDGVYLNEDGAWAGKVRDDGFGPWVELFDDYYGDFVPAREDWAEFVIREIPPITAPAVSAPAA